jgi:diguanylate cyclase (GGDEF)-like protein
LEEEVYKVVARELRDKLDEFDVVPPDLYASIFKSVAQKHGVEAKIDESQLCGKIVESKLEQFDDISKKTSQNVNKLSENTKDAMEAIKKGDNEMLQRTLDKTNELKKEIDNLRKLIYNDELTKVYNRKWLNDNLLDDNECFIHNGVLVVIDLNFFKMINDNFGHIAGDRVLMFIAKQLKMVCEKCIRYGGDEFFLVYEEAKDEKEIKMKLNRLRDQIFAKKLKIHEHTFKVSFSFGLARFKKGDKFSDVTEIADKKMYSDKEAIKQRIKTIL